jgi:pimeloyl-ACP methyl ester carboxylesterase
VCSYDRAGLGQSDADDVGPRTAQLMVYDLAELLAAAGETGPFVLVADGYATPTARVFAAQHADSVKGIVLLGPDRRHRVGAGEAFDIDRSDAQALAANIAKAIVVVVVPDDESTGSALKEKPAEVVKTIRRLVRAALGGESAAR